MFLILCGKSGSGKDTIARHLEDTGFKTLVSTTTRPMREGEVDGVDYNFTTREEFFRLIEDNLLIEHREYHVVTPEGNDIWYYGLPKQSVTWDANYVVVLDLKGTSEFMKFYGRDHCFVCYIDVDEKLREERAKKRGSFDKAEWDRRIVADEKDFAPEIRDNLVDVTVENTGKVEKTVELIRRRYSKHWERLYKQYVES